MQNQRELQRYIELCKTRKIASFDVFGTLIQRVIAHDSDLYALVGKQLEAEDFDFSSYHGYASLRESAQQAAGTSADSGEVNLDAIYSQIQKMTTFSATEVEHFKAVEVEFHHKVTYADPYMLETVNRLRNLHIPVILISDMYLPSSVITSILRSVGYGEFDHVYVSCEMRSNKYCGTIFPKVLQELKVNARDIVHIGDSRRGDFLEPQLHGIKAVLYHSAFAPRGKEWFTRFAQIALTRSQAVHEQEASVSPAYKFGYSYAGPAFAAMMQWIEREVRERKLSNLFFLSREGGFLQQCWKEWNSSSTTSVPVHTQYLHVSRKSTLLPSLYAQVHMDPNASYATLIQTVLTNRLLTVSQLLDELGVPADDEEAICEQYSVKKDQIISRPFPKNVCTMINDTVGDKAQENFGLLVQYVKQEGLNTAHAAIVDIGWKATMQISLQQVLCCAQWDTQLVGLYAGLSQESPLPSAIAAGCFFNQDKNHQNEELLTGFRELFETLCMPNEGTTVGYLYHEGQVIPQLGTKETSAKDREIIDAYQQGILHFFQDLRSSAYRDIAIPAHRAFYVLAQQLYSPSKQLLQQFATVHTYDHGVVIPVAQRYPLRMLFQPREMMKSFLDSPWRVGWLALNLPTRHPGKLYLRLRKLMEK